MTINVVISSPGEPGAVTTVQDGATIAIPSGMTLRIEVADVAGDTPRFLSPAELEAGVAGDDVVVQLPDGQTLVLHDHAEIFVEHALESALGATGGPAADNRGPNALNTDALNPDALEPDTLDTDAWNAGGSSAQVHGPKLSIDYIGEDLAASRIDLFFDKASEGQDGGVDVDALFAALEVELGLASDADRESTARPEIGRAGGLESGPTITGLAVVDRPLDLKDVLLQTSGVPAVEEQETAATADGVLFGDLATLWSGEDDGPAVNDNDVFINA